MSGLSMVFIVLPCSAAVLMAWLIGDWRMAGLVASSAVALLIVLVSIGVPLAAFLMPTLSGSAVGAATVLPMLKARPEGAVWTRMSAALIVTFLVHLALLSTMTGLF